MADRKDQIAEYVKKHKQATGQELADNFGLSRQAVHKHLKILINNKTLLKNGNTKGTFYTLPGKTEPSKAFKKRYYLKNLEEDNVFREMSLLLNLRKALNNNTFEVVNYVFTEMLNNAIDHSNSDQCDIDAVIDSLTLFVRIRDHGIGIFYSIYSKLKLYDEMAAIGELTKGKTTTMKEKHTGEGIFFSSKAVDYIAFRSNKINLVFDNKKDDVFVQQMRSITGTEVTFRVSIASKHRLSMIFNQYAPEQFNYLFERTRVFVKLFKTEYISRSTAKRLLSGLDKFSEIILDFSGVISIGQGFADEIFRVYKKNNPDITIEIANINPVLKAMIEHTTNRVDK